MRKVIAAVVAGTLMLGLSGCGASDSTRLANVKPIVAETVLGFMTTQVSDPEVNAGTLEVQIAVWPKEEQRGLANGICLEIAREIKAKRAPGDYPDLIQIYGINGDYWLQCEPRDA